MKLLLAPIITSLALSVPVYKSSNPYYHYYGVQTGKYTYVVILNSAQVIHPGHAAVWGNVQNQRGTRWVQAGIEYDGTKQPHFYIETKNGPKDYSFRDWSWNFGQKITVKLTHVKHRWRVTINRHRSRALYFRRAFKVGTLEIFKQASAIAYINGHSIKSK